MLIPRAGKFFCNLPSESASKTKDGERVIYSVEMIKTKKLLFDKVDSKWMAMVEHRISKTLIS
jgi:hypothetical protein